MQRLLFCPFLTGFYLLIFRFLTCHLLSRLHFSNFPPPRADDSPHQVASEQQDHPFPHAALFLLRDLLWVLKDLNELFPPLQCTAVFLSALTPYRCFALRGAARLRWQMLWLLYRCGVLFRKYAAVVGSFERDGSLELARLVPQFLLFRRHVLLESKILFLAFGFWRRLLCELASVLA